MSILRELRNCLAFSVDEVAAEAGWPKRRLLQLEASDDPDASETLLLGDLYGVELDALLDGEVAVGDASPLSSLLRARHDDVSASTRFAMTRAASVARDVRRLQELQDQDCGWESVERFRANPNYEDPGVAESLAGQARHMLGLGPNAAIASVTDVLEQAGVLLLWGDLDEEVDAFSLATADLGAVIVANRRGAHMGTGFQRRVTLSHELCHILFDRPRMAALDSFCVAGSTDEDSERRGGIDDIEARARAFPAYFLAPRTVVDRIWRRAESTRDKVGHVMEWCGMGYEATRHHLAWLNKLPMGTRLQGAKLPMRSTRWDEAEPVPRFSTVERVARDTGLNVMRVRALLPRLTGGGVPDGMARQLLRATPQQFDQLRLSAGIRQVRSWAVSSSAGPADDPFGD